MNASNPYPHYNMQNYQPSQVNYSDPRGRGVGVTSPSTSFQTPAQKKVRKSGSIRADSVGTSPTQEHGGFASAAAPSTSQWSPVSTPAPQTSPYQSQTQPPSPTPSTANQIAGRNEDMVYLPGPTSATDPSSGTAVSLIGLPPQRGGSLISARAPEDEGEEEDDTGMDEDMYSAQSTARNKYMDDVKYDSTSSVKVKC